MADSRDHALPDREAPCDLIKLFAVSHCWSDAKLEEVGRRHARGRFDHENLQADVTGAE